MPLIVKPIALTIAGISLFFVWAWLSMSSIDYHPGSRFFGLCTSGWFYLGLPILFGIALIATLPFSFAARTFHFGVGWTAMFVVACIAIAATFSRALPQSRLASALKVEIPPSTVILRLRVTDSFNDGTHTYGVVTGSPRLMQEIVESNGLKQGEMPLSWLRQLIDVDTFPEFGNVFESGLLTCYHDTTDNKIYFYRRSGSRPFDK